MPLYLQVASVMRHRIESGVWKVGDKISTIEQLEAEFNVARITVRQGLDLLRDDGLVESIRGRGTFVSGRPAEKHWFNLANDLESVIDDVRDNTIKIVHIDENAAPPPLQAGEGVSAADYVQLRSVQFNRGRPFAVADLRLSRDIYVRDRRTFKRKPALPRIMEMSDVDIAHALQVVTIGVADPETAALLRVGLGEPTADCRLVLVDRANVAIYVAEFHYQRNCFSLRRDLVPKPRKTVRKRGD
ncbi:GntR family transcriptional regulator [Rhodopseudomonas sp. B29]|uniref:GntR family transcriptional regulator n=1 Tax=Rhodopseudomonas sp. B29 TaxID=95607 RepID=UPI000349DF3A|nr:GntR family transcriptional regulator [Rhodopseudomonas sp. B29]